jgi:protein-L-isoaspartate(D-aspartate) O-methyltransferase
VNGSGGEGSGGGGQGSGPASRDPRFEGLRRAMVLEQLAHRGIRDPRVLGAMAAVPRHRFVEPALYADAYDDRPLPIGFDQTISQPYMVARATELAEPRPADRALEVGAGCGYQAAVLAELCREVFAVEIIPELAARARATLTELGYTNVSVESFDGSGGWPEHAPFDVIVVSAGAPRVPPLLVDQLADGGRMVIPVGPPQEQELALIRRIGDRYETSYDTRCRYVDLLGRFGFGGSPPEA